MRTCMICKGNVDYHYSTASAVSRCENGCYINVKTSNKEVLHIFDKNFIFSMEDSSDTWREVQKELDAAIEYWKENDRYLANILSG